MTFLPPAPAPHIFLLTYPPSNFPLNAKKASSTTPNSGSELALARISAARVSLFSGMFYVAYTTLKRLEASTENLWTFSRMSHKRASCCCHLSQETRRPESNPEPLPDRRAHQRGARPRNRLRGLKTLVSGSAFLSFPKDNFAGPFGQTSKARRREGQCVRHGRQRLGTDGTDASLRKSGELRPPPPTPGCGSGAPWESDTGSKSRRPASTRTFRSESAWVPSFLTRLPASDSLYWEGHAQRLALWPEATVQCLARHAPQDASPGGGSVIRALTVK